MTTDRWAGVTDLLNRLEDMELPLLSWGIVDGYLSSADVDRAIDAQLDADSERPGAAFLTVKDYLGHMLDEGLLFQLPDPTPRYRTRLGETLRLLRNLRQLWPPRDPAQSGWWREANTLVADYRLRVAPRRYPRRTITTAEAIETLAGFPGWTDSHSSVVRRILGENKIARFQVHATESILAAISTSSLSGRIITAGTGAGKTLSFYLPALLDIAATSENRRIGPHTLALYPRIELLRDQAREAIRLVTELGSLGQSGSRPARIGLLYGNTPTEGDLQGRKERRGWRRLHDGWASPYFPCLTENCLGQLVWPDSDREGGRERLVCVVCGFATMPGTLALTRESLTTKPPDILFSTTEMLSKQATNMRLAGLLGWKGPNGTRLVLLDEVHTYAGVHGAQVGLMLRRWRHANRQWGIDSPVMVGLSATLRDAGDYFANLTGADRINVEVIAPAPNELAPISREYGIVLRGDPVSGTALLSTTIQTLMLLGRVLDNTPGSYGSVAFAFTDDLDVINRLYDDLRDAEGAQPRGRSAGTVLADLRSPTAPQSGARYAEGQAWDLPFHLKRMNRPLRVARTSSQDSGVDAGADVIAATSSLEVGFNDPRVGAVIQHKAPRDLASFLQRRGRAGRRLEMRPMTVVVLSDFGRDRLAYQSYEKLLDPEIDARSLPISNRFVVKIQATHALIDWITRATNADVRAVLSPPREAPHFATPKVVAVLQELITDRTRQVELSEHLQRALRLSADEASAAMWEEPRSLMLSVVPTALRRLESSWTSIPGDADPGALHGTPLPEFMTETLFAALDVPDVLFELPAGFPDDQPSLPIAQALREAVPGRVSRRYGYAHASHRTWLPIPDAGTELSLTAVISKGHGLGSWTASDGQSYTVVRPLTVRLASPPPDIADTSAAQPVWRSAFDYTEAALHHVDVPEPSVWTSLVETCAFALHVGGSPLNVRRMAIGADGELTRTTRIGASRTPLTVRYVHEGEPAAVGFELDVDAMILTGHLKPGGSDAFGEFPSSPAWRTLAFRRRVLEDTRLDGLANEFQRERLCQVYLHSYFALALSGVEPARATSELTGGRWASDIGQYVAMAFRADAAGGQATSRAIDALAALAGQAALQSVIEEHGALLTADELATETGDLLDRALLDTLGSAVLTAAEEALPDANEHDLAVDVEYFPKDGSYRIILSETSIGGLGLLEALHRDYVLDPRRFWEGVRRACASTEAEDVDEAMHAVLVQLAEPDTALAEATAHFRAATNIAAMDEAFDKVLAVWTENDGPPSHLLVSTFAARLLRPGSRPSIDRVVADVAKAWLLHETRLGIEIDPRTLAFHAARGDLGIDISPLTPDAIFSMLWLRGTDARAQRLSHWEPYRRNTIVERLVLEELIRDDVLVIDVTATNWLEDYVHAIESDGRAALTAPYPLRSRLAQAMREAAVAPVQRNGLRVYGRITGLRQRHGHLRAMVTLAEDLQ